MTSKRRNWVIAVPVLALAITAIALLTRSREPRYQGQSLSYWVERYAPDLLNPDGDREAAAAIQAIGTNALPVLLEWISYDRRQHPIKNATLSMLRRLPDIGILRPLRMRGRFDLAEERAELAALAFEALGERANPAIPELTQLLNTASTNVCRRSITALGGIGTPALPVLIPLVINTNASHRGFAVLAFASSPSLRTNSDVVVPLLIRCLDDGDDQVAWMTALSLVRIAQLVDPPPPLILPAITNRLGPEVPSHSQIRAMFMLSRYGHGAEAHVPTLTNLLSDSELRVRESATNALMKIAPETLTNAPPE